MTFIDTNVCLDLIAKRSPWHREAEELIKIHIKSSSTLGISVISIPTLSYLIEKNHKTIVIDDAFQNMLLIFELLDVSGQMVKLALKREWRDVEDAIQHECALHYESDCIVTRNKPDFLHAEIPVLTPTEWLSNFK